MRRNEYNRTQDFYRAKTHKEIYYYSAGIPSTAWNTFSGKVRFCLTMYNDKQISPEEQQKWYEKFKTDIIEYAKPYLILIGGIEDDHLSNLLSYELMKVALDNGQKIQITDAEEIKKELRIKKDEQITGNETILMLNNVYLECTDERIQTVRDWIYRHKEDFRVIALGGDPSKFIKRCRVKPNVLLYVDSVNVQTRV